MAEVTFDVLEAANAESFNIYSEEESDITGTVTLEVTTPDETSYTKEFTVDELAEFNSSAGLDITANALIGSTVFADGIYTFTLTEVSTGFDESTLTEGFAAVITKSVMIDSIAYDVNMTKAEKDYHNERIRLLNNLAYSAQIGATSKFTENLEILQRME